MTMVERVGNALEAVQLFSRWNDWTSDRVEGMPIEICRYGSGDEDEIVVVKRFDASWKEDDALRVTIKDALARAAIEEMRTPTEAMVDETGGGECNKWARGAWALMIDAALKEQEKAG
ncbi:hypothetical protein CHY08_07110 [Rhizobium leguminosarum bv. viciae]|uniref:hypothetical protein n=1 Tax=Rhizobium leguminosarum TaxID=384 RepID=UPI000B8CF7F6|nr:hypothetical protein [Rhizobium leguminosarum]ASR06905.1 hypothetical protein CHY08_07110 [Rhizobium leguminosarum bv. viciae]